MLRTPCPSCWFPRGTWEAGACPGQDWKPPDDDDFPQPSYGDEAPGWLVTAGVWRRRVGHPAWHAPLRQAPRWALSITDMAPRPALLSLPESAPPFRHACSSPRLSLGVERLLAVGPGLRGGSVPRRGGVLVRLWPGRWVGLCWTRRVCQARRAGRLCRGRALCMAGSVARRGPVGPALPRTTHAHAPPGTLERWEEELARRAG